jgi:hypothetical protein
MLWVVTNDICVTTALDDLALFTHFFNCRSYLHLITEFLLKNK